MSNDPMQQFFEEYAKMWANRRRFVRRLSFRSWGRFGYGRVGSLRGGGWVRLFWRVWWLDRREQRIWLERMGSLYAVAPLEGESNDAYRARIGNAAKSLGRAVDR